MNNVVKFPTNSSMVEWLEVVVREMESGEARGVAVAVTYKDGTASAYTDGADFDLAQMIGAVEYLKRRLLDAFE